MRCAPWTFVQHSRQFKNSQCCQNLKKHQNTHTHTQLHSKANSTLAEQSRSSNPPASPRNGLRGLRWLRGENSDEGFAGKRPSTSSFLPFCAEVIRWVLLVWVSAVTISQYFGKPQAVCNEVLQTWLPCILPGKLAMALWVWLVTPVVRFVWHPCLFVWCLYGYLMRSRFTFHICTTDLTNRSQWTFGSLE